VLLFDEPINGLDTDGIRWVRSLLRRLASEGRTVFVSSHLMSEMALTADQVVVIAKDDSSPKCRRRVHVQKLAALRPRAFTAARPAAPRIASSGCFGR